MRQNTFILFTLFASFVIVNAQDCTYTSSDGSYYDLTSLKNKPDIAIEELTMHETIYLAICRPTTRCPGSAVCSINSRTAGKESYGRISSNPWTEACKFIENMFISIMLTKTQK